MNKRCSLCDKKHYAKTLCEAHYKAHREQSGINKRLCSIQECGLPHYGWDLCRRHYKTEHKRRWRNSVKNTPEYKLEKNLRNRHNLAIKRAINKSHPIRHLGCTINELKLYIESLFYTNLVTGIDMTWENRGLGKDKWQIDHVIPFSAIDLTDQAQQLKICHYSNLRPMWYEEHVLKSSKERWTNET